MTVENQGAEGVTNQPESTSGGAGRAEQSSVDAFKEFEKSQGALEAMADLTGVDHAARPEPKQEEQGAAEEKSAETGEETPTEENAGEEKPAGEAKPETGAKGGKKTAKERINEVVKQRSAAEERAAAAEARAAAAEAALEATKSGKPPAKETAAEETGDDEPDPEKFEYGSLDPAYLKAVRAYDKAQILKTVQASRQDEAAQRQAEELDQKFDAQVEALDAEVGDYVEKVVLGAQEKRWALSAELGALVKQSDVGAKIAYHLASNPAESIALFHKSPLEQAAWFGRKEAEFAAPTTKGKQPAVSKADPPVENVRGQAGKFAPNSATTDFAAFEKAHAHLLNQ